MKILKVAFLFLTLTIYSSCTSLKNIPIPNATVYQLNKSKNEVSKMIDSVGVGKMAWPKDTLCDAIYYFDEYNLCFRYFRKPERIVHIAENGIITASLKDIKKHRSFLEWGRDTIELRPIKGQIVAIHNETQIARIKKNKNKLSLEISPEYEGNNTLVSSLIYKDHEWRKTNQNDNDHFLLYYLIFLL